MGSQGGAYFSPKVGLFTSNSLAVSSRTKPTTWPAIGTSVNMKKSAAALVASERKTCLRSQP
jgi:hypothetical protein